MSIFTGRNEVVAKVIFLHLCVILFTGGSASVHAGIPPPLEAHPPSGSTPTPPPPGSRLRHTANEQPVRILLECIFVSLVFSQIFQIECAPNLFMTRKHRCLTVVLLLVSFQMCANSLNNTRETDYSILVILA